MKFLIDECLTVDLVSIAMQSGHQAHHVAHIGKAGWKDWNIAAFATAGDFVLVTNNASDFKGIYKRQALHAGLVIIIPNANRTIQQRIFQAVIEELMDVGELINRVLEANITGDDVVFKTYNLP